MKYKMLLLDLDGTLLNDSGIVSDKNYSILKHAYELGMKIIIATGRRYNFAKIPVSCFDFPYYILSDSGTILFDTDGSRLIINSIDLDTFKSILNIGHTFEMYPALHIHCSGSNYDIATELENDNPVYHSYVNIDKYSHYIKIDKSTDYANIKILLMCYMDNIEKISRFKNAIEKNFYGKINTNLTMTLKRIGPLLEISSIQGTKWKTALKFAEKFNIKSSEIISFGDDSNDTEMLMKSGLGIAVKNAMDNAKDAARYVSEYTNNESAVALELGKILI